MQKENRLERLIFSLYISFALIFIILYIPLHPYPFSYLIKCVPVASLLIFTLIVKRGPVRIFLASGLFFFLVGDVLLDLDYSRFFIFGLGCFFLAHIFYTVLFFRDLRFYRKSLLIIAAVIVYGLTMAWLLRNMDPNRIIPVMAYLAVISLMTISAALYSTGRSWKGANLVVIGAAVFMLSGTVIVVNQFLVLIPNSPMISLPLYWAAQLMIVRGIQISD
ncbi:MAG: lysoplasmalogenase [Spirochaetaceae bacterium]|nr:lysoplasmalogenase [Spirochaetaceae bacterium]RKX97974.1 MAG: hypothetical protein DRZ90_04400 [Spirochaetota bacterium]